MSKILIIAESLYARDRDKWFTSWQWQKLRFMLREAGIEPSDCRFAYAIQKYLPPRDYYRCVRKDGGFNLGFDDTNEHLDDLVNSQMFKDSNVVVALHPSIYGYLTGLRFEKNRGNFSECLFEPKMKVIGTFDPERINKEYRHHYTLLCDLKKVKDNCSTKEIVKPNFKLTIAPNYLDSIKALQVVRNSPAIAWDVETYESHVTWIGFAWSATEAVSIKIMNAGWTVQQEAHLLKLINDILTDPSIKTIAHNAPYDVSIMAKHYGIISTNLYMDTQVAAHCVIPELPRSLAYLSSLYLNVPSWKASSIEDMGTYNALDCTQTFALYEFFEQELERFGVRKIYESEMQQLEPAMFMEHRGLKVDKEELERTEITITTLLKEAETLLEQKVGEPIVGAKTKLYRSNKKLCTLLYDTLGLPAQTKKNDKGQTVRTADSDALAELKKKVDNPVLNLISDCLKYSKILGTYLKLNTSEKGTVHASYRVTGTDSGRWSSKGSIIYPYGNGKDNKLNLQNIPEEIRNIFVPHGEGNVFVAVDLSSAEANVVAYMSGNQELIDIYKFNFGKSKNEVKDVYKRLVGQIYSKSIEEVTAEERQKIGKPGNHASNYNIKAPTFAKMTGLDKKEAAFILDGIYANNPDLTNWHKEMEREVLETGCLTNPFGRKHLFLGRLMDSRKNFTLKSVYSQNPQSTIGDHLNEGMCRYYYDPERVGELDLQLHDAIYAECKPIEVHACVASIRKALIHPILINGEETLIDVEVKVGKNWRDLELYNKEENYA